MNAENAIEVRNVKKKFKIFYDKGNDLMYANPLVDSKDRAQRLAEWCAEYYRNDSEYDIKVIFTDNAGNMIFYDRLSGERELSFGDTLDLSHE